MTFKSITSDQSDALLTSLRSGKYNLLLGAGFSMDSSNSFGNLPSGADYTKELCNLKSVGTSYSLQKIFSILTLDEVFHHVTKRFQGCVPGPTAKLASSFVWKRIFTWNIDDVVERSYENRGRQKLIPVHYSDDYVEASNLSDLILVHLHGSVLMPDKGYVFSRNEYVNQIRNISHWMVVLAQFMQSEPMIISGTSLDEVDLDYYLSHRTKLTTRDDRAPSILVEKTDDAVTEKLCDQHGLLHFVGYSHDFFEFCSKILPNKPTPYELIPFETQSLVPSSFSKRAALAFQADFELVPAAATQIEDASRFLYGHAPTWSDIASDFDVPRQIVPGIINEVERIIRANVEKNLILLTENAGTDKTTILRRVAFDLSNKGYRVLLCSALSRIDNAAPDIIDQIDGSVVIVADNFADQASSIGELLERLERKDIVVLAAERAYRKNYLDKVVSSKYYKLYSRLGARQIDVERLMQRYTHFGLVGDHSTLKKRANFIQNVRTDPIAVICCRIMNDYKPLDSIIADLLSDTSRIEQDRYALVSLARDCFKGGVRYEVLTACLGGERLKEQFSRAHPLSLAYYDKDKDFVVPENATIADIILKRIAQTDRERMLYLFISLANNIAARVNRKSIIGRTPEARLSGRIFDFDDITSKYLGPQAETFYTRTRSAWKWNSRYWEQVSLLKLAEYYQYRGEQTGYDALVKSVQHARHAVSIEFHPFPLSTLGKVLMVKMSVSPAERNKLYGDAFRSLSKAIEFEAAWSRNAVQPFASLFRGTVQFLRAGGVLNSKQNLLLGDFIRSAENRFGKEAEIQILIDEVQEWINKN